MRPSSATCRRGLSLLEVVVVLAIVITVLAVALPIAVALLREQKGLAAEILRGDTLPLLHARLDRDLGAARGFTVLPSTGDDPGLDLSLAPRKAENPTVVWTLSGTSLSRREVPADGSAGPPPHTWQVEGAFSLSPEELLGGRLGFLWIPLSGPAELLVFEAPHGGETLP